MRISKTAALTLALGVALAGFGLLRARSDKEVPALKVWIAIDQHCNGTDGKPLSPRTLAARSSADHFPVVIENVSHKPGRMEVKAKIGGSSQQHTWLRLPTIATHAKLRNHPRWMMRAIVDTVDPHL